MVPSTYHNDAVQSSASSRFCIRQMEGITDNISSITISKEYGSFSTLAHLSMRNNMAHLSMRNNMLNKALLDDYPTNDYHNFSVRNVVSKLKTTIRGKNIYDFRIPDKTIYIRF